MNAAELNLQDAYEMVLKKMVECGMYERKVIANLTVKEKDSLVNRFMKENPDIMLACVHWKVDPQTYHQDFRRR